MQLVTLGDIQIVVGRPALATIDASGQVADDAAAFAAHTKREPLDGQLGAANCLAGVLGQCDQAGHMGAAAAGTEAGQTGSGLWALGTGPPLLSARTRHAFRGWGLGKNLANLDPDA